MLGGNEYHGFDKPREAIRLVKCRESRHVDYERLRDKDDAIHNGFEGKRDRNANESYSDITRKVRVNVPTYDGKTNATNFSNWIVAMEDYFDSYKMSGIKWVRFSKMKLVGLTRKFWHTVITNLKHMNQPPFKH